MRIGGAFAASFWREARGIIGSPRGRRGGSGSALSSARGSPRGSRASMRGSPRASDLKSALGSALGCGSLKPQIRPRFAGHRLRRETGEGISAAFRRGHRHRRWRGAPHLVGESGPGRARRRLRHLRFGMRKAVAGIVPGGVGQRSDSRRHLGARRALRQCIAAGVARTMLGSTTMSVGPPIIRRCSILSRRTSTSRRRPSTAAASITANRGIRPRCVLAPRRLPANWRTSQAASADQAEHHHEREDEGQCSRHALSPPNTAFLRLGERPHATLPVGD